MLSVRSKLVIGIAGNTTTSVKYNEQRIILNSIATLSSPCQKFQLAIGELFYSAEIRSFFLDFRDNRDAQLILVELP
jgi:hypothetical protein